MFKKINKMVKGTHNRCGIGKRGMGLLAEAAHQ